MKNRIKVFAIVIMAIFAFTTTGYSQVKGNGNVTSVKRDVSGFSGIKLECSADVFITQGNTSVVVKTDENLQELVSTKVTDGILEIDIKGRGYRSCKVMEVHIAMPELNKIRNTGSGDIRISGDYKCTGLDIGIKGSGDFNGKLDVRDLELQVMGSGDVKITGIKGDFKVNIIGSGDVDVETVRCEKVLLKSAGSGDISIEGRSNNLIVSQFGSGDINAYSLQTVIAEITNSGSGDIAISVSDELKAFLNGSGDLTYRGNPAKVDVSTNGSGDIYKK